MVDGIDCKREMHPSILNHHRRPTKTRERHAWPSLIGVGINSASASASRNAGITTQSSPIMPTISANTHSNPSLSTCRLDTAKSGPLRSAYICLPIMSSAKNEAIPTLPSIPANLLYDHVQLRGEKQHSACSAHLLLPSRLYRRRFLGNWSWLQPQALVWHHRRHILRA
jgi:hypothetical protein